MSYEDAILDFLAKPENLPIALEVAEYVEKLKDSMLEKFWLEFAAQLEGRFDEAKHAPDWKFRKTNTDNLLDKWTRCAISPNRPASAAPAYTEVCFEHNGRGWGYRFYLGVRWTKPVEKIDPFPSLERLRKVMLKHGLKKSSSWGPGWKWTPFYAHGETFLIRMGNDPEKFVAEMVGQTWDLFVALEKHLDRVNQDLQERFSLSD